MKTTDKMVSDIISYNYLDNIIIVDNASTDNSYEMLFEKYNTNPKITILKADYNGGFSYGNLIGIKYAKYFFKSEYIFVSNPDIIVSEETLKKTVETFNFEPNVVACAPYVKRPYTNETCDYFYGGSFWYDLIMFMPFVWRLFKKELKVPENNKIQEVKLLPGCFLCLNTTIFDVTELYDTNLFLCYEEQVMSEKVRNAGLKMLLNTNISLMHEESVSIKKNLNFIKKLKIVFDSYCFYYEKYKHVSTAQLFFAKVIFKIGIIIRKLCYRRKNNG